MQKPVIALCADKNMEAGLHVTLYSLLKNYSRKDLGVKIHLFLQNFSERNILHLRATLDGTQTFYELHIQPVALNVFKDFRSLHRNYMTYARLILADILTEEENFLYLDSDLLVGVDVYDLFNTDLQNQTVGAVIDGGTIDWSLKKDFFLKMGLHRSGPYFNAGVMLFDATRWRIQNLTQICLQFCEAHPDDLKAADQTVLNYVFHKKIMDLNKCYNNRFYPTSSPINEEQARRQITHFVGSPKPWDPFGRFLHSGYTIFKKYFEETAFNGHFRLQLASFHRVLNLRRSYFRCISAKFKS
jgi:lipopolysaccharide biosynthesis glycosyltransferase